LEVVAAQADRDRVGPGVVCQFRVKPLVGEQLTEVLVSRELLGYRSVAVRDNAEYVFLVNGGQVQGIFLQLADHDCIGSG
jgi:hypothetical protein